MTGMVQRTIRQSALRRAINDTISAQKTLYFMWAVEFVLVAAGGSLLQMTAPESASLAEKVVRSVVGVLIGAALPVLLIFVSNLFLAPYRQRDEARLQLEDRIRQNIGVKPITGKRSSDWEKTEHLIWAGLEVTNRGNRQLEDSEVNVVSCLIVQEKQGSLNGTDYDVLDSYEWLQWLQTGIYWSERNAQPKQLGMTIPVGASRIALIAYQDNSNGGSFNFNSPLREWRVGGARIDIEINDSIAVIWNGSYYIECHPNYLRGDRGHFEFIEWDKWASNRNITSLASI